jgi:hypothetical protein
MRAMYADFLVIRDTSLSRLFVRSIAQFVWCTPVWPPMRCHVSFSAFRGISSMGSATPVASQPGTSTSASEERACEDSDAVRSGHKSTTS